MQIILTDKSSYKWYSNGNIYFRGYIFSQKLNMVIKTDTVIKYLSQVKSYTEFQKLLQNIDGIYSIIIRHGTDVWLAVDISRSMPMYVSANGEFISDSAEAVRESLNLEPAQANSLRLAELLTVRYTSGNNTVYDAIKQLDAGQSCIIADGKLKFSYHYIHRKNIIPQNREEVKTRLSAAMTQMMHEMKLVIGNRPVVLSLSGGYDSRVIACLLKKAGVQNVRCYTYGKESSFEIQRSKAVADALGYPWTCVQYTDEKILSIVDRSNREFHTLFDGHDGMGYLQNFIEVKELHETGWIPDNAIFLTGLCMDMPSGAYLKESMKADLKEYSISGVAKYINKRFERYQLTAEALSQLNFEQEEELKNIGFKAIEDFPQFINAIDAIMTKQVHSRVYLHMNRAHDYFGYEWLLPGWNKNILEVFYSMPPEYRFDQNLYKEWLLNDLAKDFGSEVSATKIINRHSKNRYAVIIKRKIAALILPFLFLLGIPIRRKVDINNFAVLEVYFFKRIKQKQLINMKHASIVLLYGIYLLEQHYGLHFAKDLPIKKNT